MKNIEWTAVEEGRLRHGDKDALGTLLNNMVSMFKEILAANSKKNNPDPPMGYGEFKRHWMERNRREIQEDAQETQKTNTLTEEEESIFIEWLGTYFNRNRTPQPFHMLTGTNKTPYSIYKEVVEFLFPERRF